MKTQSWVYKVRFQPSRYSITSSSITRFAARFVEKGVTNKKLFNFELFPKGRQVGWVYKMKLPNTDLHDRVLYTHNQTSFSGVKSSVLMQKHFMSEKLFDLGFGDSL